VTDICFPVLGLALLWHYSLYYSVGTSRTGPDKAQDLPWREIAVDSQHLMLCQRICCHPNPLVQNGCRVGGRESALVSTSDSELGMVGLCWL